jgi:hypothetical protein
MPEILTLPDKFLYSIAFFKKMALPQALFAAFRNKQIKPDWNQMVIGHVFAKDNSDIINSKELYKDTRKGIKMLIKNAILTVIAASLLFASGCSTASTTPSGSSNPSASPAASASPSPAANTGVNLVASTGVTLEQMKAYSACFKASGSDGAALATGLDARITLAEGFLKSESTAALAQGQLDLAYNTGKDLQGKYNIDCIK